MWATEYPLSFWLFAASAMAYVIASATQEAREDANGRDD